MPESVFPGINSQVTLWHFTNEERSIIYKIAKEWYVTNGGGTINLGPKSTYRFFLIKPTDNYREMFNIERELVVILSPYQNFEPRSLDAIDWVYKRYQKLRLERLCSVVISQDDKIEYKLSQLLKSDPEAQVVVPFAYYELLSKTDDYFIRNRFKTNFYSRDLFACEAPLKKDLYFFGRGDLVHKIVNRHKSNENSGLLGLRKTGKTSVIFGVKRALNEIEAKSVFIDCQNTAFHRRRWNKALFYICSEIKKQNDIDINLVSENDYTEEQASLIFEKEICRLYEKLNRRNVLIIFDEIENITFNVSPSEHWSKGYDFIFFWQTLRSLFQKLDNVFSYLIVGTNPMCIEMALVHDKDNPIFNQFPFEYIQGFNVRETTQMVRKIGRIMGLNFDDIIYGRLTEDFGGHPYLIRHVCSVINGLVSEARPVRIDKSIYEEAKGIFTRSYSNYIEMIISVLQKYYSDEYAMLEYLAVGDIETFNDIAKISPYYTNHLLGYGIIEKQKNGYSFKIDCVRQYLQSKLKYKKIKLSTTEMFAEISERRNHLEPKLRNIIRNQLMVRYGKSNSRDKVVEVLGEPRKSKYASGTSDLK